MSKIKNRGKVQNKNKNMNIIFFTLLLRLSVYFQAFPTPYSFFVLKKTCCFVD